MQTNMIPWAKFVATMILGLILSSPTQAWDLSGRFYLGAGLGLQHNQSSFARFSEASIPCTPIDCEYGSKEHSFAPSIFGGVQINEYVGVEVGYIDLQDTYNVRLTDRNFPAPTFVSVDQDSSAVFLRGVFTLPLKRYTQNQWLNPVSLSAVAGLTRWQSDLKFVADLRGAGFSRNTSHANQNGAALTFGGRVNYDANEQVRLSLSWDRYRGVGDRSVAIQQTFPARVSTVKTDVDVFSFNVAYRFR